VFRFLFFHKKASPPNTTRRITPPATPTAIPIFAPDESPFKGEDEGALELDGPVPVVCEVADEVVAVVVEDVVEVDDCEAAITKWGENVCAPVESFRLRKNSSPGVANRPGVHMYEFETRSAMQMLVTPPFQCWKIELGSKLLPSLAATYKTEQNTGVLTLNMMHHIRIPRRPIIQRQSHRTNIPTPSNRKRHTSNNIRPRPIREYQCCMDDTHAA
jgi:hypothetical protein